ncbi:unnamed protein product [Rotaria sordida]|uniref:Uncharacterized protein n=2 Tax=Rotaria sordida TaxID=392033 RepID=A0A815DTD4_9BILA|nr:unnamed protein product [Rotaria sordida]CAF1363046.1 unnamed protein product [Rotaria sordida]CAF1575068.1 unnamed protein product [Rotaria sordida]
MKLLAIFILYKENDKSAKILQDEFNLESFGYFQRHHIRQILVFSARTVTERTALGVRQSVTFDEHLNGMVHVFVRPDGLASVTISDNEYPQRVAYNLLSKVMNDFSNLYPPASWSQMEKKTDRLASLSELLKKYQNPQEADLLMSLEKDIDDTKVVLINTIEKLLERGENIDKLLQQSKDLSDVTKGFAETAKKTNKCCNLF